METDIDGDAARSVRRIGALLRSTRQERGLSIEALARAAGVGAGTVSQYERGRGNPTLQTLRKLARALDLSLAAFHASSSTLDSGDDLADPHGTDGSTLVTRWLPPVRAGRVDVVRADERRQLVLPGPGPVYEILSPDLDGAILLMQSRFRVGFDNFDEPFQHPGEEVVTLTAGRLEGRIADTQFTLEPGDSVTFDASLPHGWRTLGDTDAELYSALTPPVLK